MSHELQGYTPLKTPGEMADWLRGFAIGQSIFGHNHPQLFTIAKWIRSASPASTPGEIRVDDPYLVGLDTVIGAEEPGTAEPRPGIGAMAAVILTVFFVGFLAGIAATLLWFCGIIQL